MWGGGFGYRVPQSARDVAKAFFAGRTCKRTNCATDGEQYLLEGNCIARRVRPENEIAEISKAVQGLPYRRSLEFTFCGWPTQMTCRHLLALGVDASLDIDYRLGPLGGIDKSTKEEIALLNGRRVDSQAWYTPEQLTDMPKWRRTTSQYQPALRARVVSPQNLELCFD